MLIFIVFNIISCPPNFLWQTWLETAFPGYSKDMSPQEKGKLVDEKVGGHSTATDSADTNLRGRNSEKKQSSPTPDSAPKAQEGKQQFSILNTAIKFLLDQSVGAAVNTVLFIMGIAKLRGQSWQFGWEATKAGFWPLVSAGQKLWPLVSLISLTLVPVEHRMVFGSIIGIGWNIFLTLMAGGQKHKTE